jgi:hypothetical protein
MGILTGTLRVSLVSHNSLAGSPTLPMQPMFYKCCIDDSTVLAPSVCMMCASHNTEWVLWVRPAYLNLPGLCYAMCVLLQVWRACGRPVHHPGVSVVDILAAGCNQGDASNELLQ